MFQVPSYMSEFVMVTAWVQDTGMHLYPNTDIGGKYTVLSNGELYINNAGASDAFKTYTCRTVNRLTGTINNISHVHAIISKNNFIFLFNPISLIHLLFDNIFVRLPECWLNIFLLLM